MLVALGGNAKAELAADAARRVDLVKALRRNVADHFVNAIDRTLRRARIARRAGIFVDDREITGLFFAIRFSRREVFVDRDRHRVSLSQTSTVAGCFVVLRCGAQPISRDVLRCEAASNIGILAFTGDWDKRNCGKMLVGLAGEAVQRMMPLDFADFRPLERRVEGDAAPDFDDRRWQQPH